MNRLSVTIITLNEAAHIAAAIDSASFADEILVVDSGSSDGTTDIAASKGVRVLTRAWTGYVDQKNFAAEEASNDWIFSLDADERIPAALAEEIRAVLSTDPPCHGYRVPRVAYERAWQDAIDACRAGRPSPVGEWIADDPADRVQLGDCVPGGPRGLVIYGAHRGRRGPGRDGRECARDLRAGRDPGRG